jgi:sterol desaturase/sphingolipid hydroxylase (fatty acid hydroxylase superfamily)
VHVIVAKSRALHYTQFRKFTHVQAALVEIEGILRDTIQAVAMLLRQTLPDSLAWATNLGRRTLEFLFGPILDHGGRYPWWGLIAALGIAFCAFLLDQNRRSGGGIRDFPRFCFPREIYRSRSTWVDVKVGFFNFVLFGGGALNVTWRITKALFATWISLLLVAGFGPIEHHASWGPVSIVLFALAISMASDLGYFLFHWSSHVFPPLWAIHKLHHSAEVMTPLTAGRVHALERPITGPFMALTTGVLVGPLLYVFGYETNVPTIFGLDMAGAMFFLLGHNLHHSHVWVYFGPIIGRVIVSPAQHQIHHSCLPRHLDKNFAEHWAFWDTLFGTLYLPQGRETLKLGLAGYSEQPHPGVWAANIRPVYDSVAACVSLARTMMAWLGRWRLRNERPDAGLIARTSADPR